jgi:hypothetical protein
MHAGWVIAKLMEPDTWSGGRIWGPFRGRAPFGILAGVVALIPLLSFLGSTVIEPATRPPEILVTASMVVSSVQMRAGLLVGAVTIKASIRNPTNARVRLLANTLNVQAFKTLIVPSNKPTDAEYSSKLGLFFYSGLHKSQATAFAASPEGRSEVLQGAPISRYAVNNDEVTKDSPFVYSIVPFRTQKGWFLDPGEEDTRTDIFFLPVVEFDYLRLKFDTFSGRDSEMLNSVDVAYDVHNAGDTNRGDLYVTGRLHRLNGSTGFVDIDVAQGSDYGLIFNSTTFDLSLWEARMLTPTNPETPR